MNKYELALVVSAKIEDDARAAVVEKAKEYITRAGGAVTEVEEWGKKKLAYDIQHMSEGFYYFIQFDAAPESSIFALTTSANSYLFMRILPPFGLWLKDIPRARKLIYHEDR